MGFADTVCVFQTEGLKWRERLGEREGEMEGRDEERSGEVWLK